VALAIFVGALYLYLKHVWSLILRLVSRSNAVALKKALLSVTWIPGRFRFLGSSNIDRAEDTEICPAKNS